MQSKLKKPACNSGELCRKTMKAFRETFISDRGQLCLTKVSCLWLDLFNTISNLACLSQKTYSGQACNSRPSMPFPSDTSFVQTSQRGSLDVSSSIFNASSKFWDRAQHAATFYTAKGTLVLPEFTAATCHGATVPSRHHW